MRATRHSDDGSAVVEFIVVGVAVLVPLVYVIQAAAVVHAAVLASGQAAREAARVFSGADTASTGRLHATTAARLAFADQGLALPEGALRIACIDGDCLAPGSAVAVSLDWHVPLPWLPDGWHAGVPISTSQRVPVDDFRSSQAVAP